jgi:HPt (histidine-containing phosphotransfer) domain-containing protein
MQNGLIIYSKPIRGKIVKVNLKEYNSTNLRSIAGDDTGFVVEILQTFLETLKADIATVQIAFENEDWPNVQFVTHRLRSAAGSVGAENTQLTCRLLEEYLKNNQIEKGNLNSLHKNFLIASEFDLSEIKKELTKLGANSF